MHFRKRKAPLTKFQLQVLSKKNVWLLSLFFTCVLVFVAFLSSGGVFPQHSVGLLPRTPIRARSPSTVEMRSTFRRLVHPPHNRVDLHAPAAKRVLAFYFPQFHEFEVNNVLWGKGYTDFRGVEAAITARHGYPVVRPLDGFYSPLDYWVRHRQARVARQYGVYGFVFYHYWFSGSPVMEAPLLSLLEDDEPDPNRHRSGLPRKLGRGDFCSDAGFSLSKYTIY